MRVAEHNALQENVATNQQWFAMRATYHREMTVKTLLDQNGIETYLPLKQVVKTVRGRKVRAMLPLVSSLIFVHCDKERLQRFKAKVPHLQYMTTPVGGQNLPITVPKRQMDEFMAVTKCDDSRMVFFKPGELELKRGTHVRLHGGVFDGVEGTFMKVSGRRNRRVVIEVKGVIAVAIDCEDAQFVESL